MAILLSLAALRQGAVQLSGEISPETLGFETLDPCVESHRPFQYDLRAELLGSEILLEGRLETLLDCQCVRCLEPFEWRLLVEPWTALLPLEGEDAPPMINESVDLTPQIREDSLLALPQHPVCRPECRGIAGQAGLDPNHSSAEGPPGKSAPARTPGTAVSAHSAWSALDTLKLD
ncbi:MAG: DUF177 domain-containing protein [Verrucomicrobiae bacterium]|nr:DUF177 domain-containing protein [Verrucomicrobiae bacterium]